MVEGRFNWKLRPKVDGPNLRKTIAGLQKLSCVGDFCVYSKKNKPEELRCYVKLLRKSRPSIFQGIATYLQGKPYQPAKIVKDLPLHFSKRSVYVLYNQEDDTRELQDIDNLIENHFFNGDVDYYKLLQEALKMKDKRLFFHLLNEVEKYSELDLICDLIRNQNNPRECKISATN